MIELIESFELCDIWRIRNPTEKRFTFRQNQISGYIQRKLDYFFVSNRLQESINNTDILASLSTDHSPISFTLRRSQITAKGKGLWIFNSSLTLIKEFVKKMKEHISTCLNLLEKENFLDDQVRCEYLKYEVRKFSIKFSKAQAKKLRLERVLLEKNLKNLESNMNNHEEYNDCKTHFEQIYKIKANGTKIRSKCEWYEHGKTSSKFFLNLEKTRAIQGQVRAIISNDKETNDETEINNHIYSFFNYLYKETLSFSSNNLETYLNTISFPKLTKEKSKTLDG